MNRLPDPSARDDELRLPMVFVPHGEAPPAGWLARHPDWVRIPATLVPRKAAETDPPPPIVQADAPALALGAALSGEAVAAAALAALAGAAADWLARQRRLEPPLPLGAGQVVPRSSARMATSRTTAEKRRTECDPTGGVA